MTTFGVAATDGAGVAGGRVGIAALLALTLVTGALVAPELLQAARKAPTPARAVPLRKRRRLITGRTGPWSLAVIDLLRGDVPRGRLGQSPGAAAGALPRTTKVCSGSHDRRTGSPWR